MRSPALHTPCPSPRPCSPVAWHPGQLGTAVSTPLSKGRRLPEDREGGRPAGKQQWSSPALANRAGPRRKGGPAGRGAPAPHFLSTRACGRNRKGLGPARLWDPEMVRPGVQGAGRARPPASCLRLLRSQCSRRTLGAREASTEDRAAGGHSGSSRPSGHCCTLTTSGRGGPSGSARRRLRPMPRPPTWSQNSHLRGRPLGSEQVPAFLPVAEAWKSTRGPCRRLLAAGHGSQHLGTSSGPGNADLERGQTGLRVQGRVPELRGARPVRSRLPRQAPPLLDVLTQNRRVSGEGRAPRPHHSSPSRVPVSFSSSACCFCCWILA